MGSILVSVYDIGGVWRGEELPPAVVVVDSWVEVGPSSPFGGSVWVSVAIEVGKGVSGKTVGSNTDWVVGCDAGHPAVQGTKEGSLNVVGRG